MQRSLVIHGHYYQPPREDPWYDQIETEQSAAPYHDWNERIERECYRAVVAARITDGAGRIVEVLNTLAWTSFNVGPTLCEWLQRHAPDTYAAVIEADRLSAARLGGYGNAIAHPYHHVILPLASRRDKETEVRWGLIDFRRRFGREPLGMWLPETAVDDETLDVLAAAGIQFTIVAPHQVRQVPPNGLPGRYRTQNGREITLFPYNGDISHGIAFGGLARDAHAWLDAMWAVRPTRRKTPVSSAAVDARVASKRASRRTNDVLIAAATDGETYGHHHKFAEMALARVLRLADADGARVENFASFLATHPPEHDVELVEPSSWSCTHGVERWRSDCGCRTDGARNPSQAWRAPLREALEGLAASVHGAFLQHAAIENPWAARDAYGAVVASGGDANERDTFAVAYLRRGHTAEQQLRSFELLEAERDTLRMVTSCAWFFDDIGGLEPRQVLKYAARAMDLARVGPDDRNRFLLALGRARSNDAAVGTAATVFQSLHSLVDAEANIAAAVAALHHEGISLACDDLPDNVAVTVAGDDVVVTWKTTGRTSRYRVAIVSGSPHELSVAVSREDGLRRVVGLPAFPERPRRALRRSFRQQLLASVLTSAERARLIDGSSNLRETITGALVRRLAELPSVPPVAAITPVLGIVDLMEQLESPIPFDVQSLVWRRWGHLLPEQRGVLKPLFDRLGFAAVAGSSTPDAPIA